LRPNFFFSGLTFSAGLAQEYVRDLATVVLVESFRSLNRIRLEGRAGRPKLHCILNFKYLEANLTSLLGKRTTAEAAKVVKKKENQGQKGVLIFIVLLFFINQ
jgi:hypothetical protein